MFKEYMVVILLHVLIIKDTKAKEDVIKIEKITDWYDIGLDHAIGNCGHRPTIRSKLFSFTPPVSQQ
jgi:hypothetical protein